MESGFNSWIQFGDMPKAPSFLAAIIPPQEQYANVRIVDFVCVEDPTEALLLGTLIDEPIAPH